MACTIHNVDTHTHTHTHTHTNKHTHTHTYTHTHTHTHTHTYIYLWTVISVRGHPFFLFFKLPSFLKFVFYKAESPSWPLCCTCFFNHLNECLISANIIYTVWVKKKEGNPSLTQNISKLIKDVTTLISVGDSIVILLSFDRLFIHLWPRMAAQQSIL